MGHPSSPPPSTTPQRTRKANTNRHWCRYQRSCWTMTVISWYQCMDSVRRCICLHSTPWGKCTIASPSMVTKTMLMFVSWKVSLQPIGRPCSTWSLEALLISMLCSLRQLGKPAAYKNLKVTTWSSSSLPTVKSMTSNKLSIKSSYAVASLSASSLSVLAMVPSILWTNLMMMTANYETAEVTKPPVTWYNSSNSVNSVRTVYSWQDRCCNSYHVRCNNTTKWCT